MKKHSVLSNLAFLTSATFGAQILGIFPFIFFTRMMTDLELSIFPAYFLLGNMSTLFFSFGVFPVLYRNIPSLRTTNLSAAYAMINTVLKLSIVNSFIFFVLSFFLAEKISFWIFDAEIYVTEIKILSVAAFFFGIDHALTYVFKSFERFSKFATTFFYFSLFKAIITVVFFIGFGLKGICVGLLLSKLFSVIVSVYYLRDIIWNRAGNYPLMELLKESWPFYLEGYLIFIRSEGDNLVVITFLSAELLPIYYIAKKVYGIVNALYYSIYNVLTPRLSSYKNSILEFTTKANDILRISTTLLLPLIIFTVGSVPTLLILLAGNYYEAAIFPGMLLVLYSFFVYHFILPYGTAVLIYKSPVQRFLLNVVEAILLMLTLLIFTTPFQIVGIALARLLTAVLVGGYLYLIIHKKVTNIPFKGRALLFYFLLSSIAIIPMLYTQLNYAGILPFCCSTLFSGSIFLGMLYFFDHGNFFKEFNKISPFKIPVYQYQT